MYTHATSADRSCIRLRVQVLSGRGYSFKNLDIVRVIDILPRQTLEELSRCIESAFDREMDFHLWEFYFGAKHPYDRNAMRFGGSDSGDYDASDGSPSGADVTLEQLGLRPRKVFHYLYDFGDDWWHKISVAKLNAPVAEGGYYPRIVETFGKSPKQYFYGEEGESQFVGDDDEDDWEDDEDEESQDGEDSQDGKDGKDSEDSQDSQDSQDGKGGKDGEGR